MRKYKKNSGFTLLELLIVVAIIGILTSIVVVATSDARKKGADAGIKRQLQEIRSEIELFYNRGSVYRGSIVTFGPDECSNSFDNEPSSHVFHSSYKVFQLIQKIRNSANPSDAYCAAGLNSWAVAVKLKTTPTDSWCVDSSGKSKQVNLLPESSINGITYLCN